MRTVDYVNFSVILMLYASLPFVLYAAWFQSWEGLVIISQFIADGFSERRVYRFTALTLSYRAGQYRRRCQTLEVIHGIILEDLVFV